MDFSSKKHLVITYNRFQEIEQLLHKANHLAGGYNKNILVDNVGSIISSSIENAITKSEDAYKNRKSLE